MIGLAQILLDAIKNGEMTVGLSAGVDAALAEGDKLKVCKEDDATGGRTMLCGGTSVAVLYIAEYALSHIPVNEDSFLERLTVNSVLAICTYGLIDTNNPDVLLEKNAKNNFGPNERKITMDTDGIRDAAALICATKLNYFQTNHHTGQGALSGYPLKVFNLLYNKTREITITPLITSVIHKIGHWASTKKVLSQIGIKGLSGYATMKGLVDLDITPELLLRAKVMPAGTGSLGLCYAILKRMKMTKLIYAVENPGMFLTISEAYKMVQSDSASYHVSAKYLTGKDRKTYDDSEFTSMLGLLGSFITNFYPNSSICRSPKIKKGEKPIYKDYEGYDEGFDVLCATVKREQAKNKKDDVSEFLSSYKKKSPEEKAIVDDIIKRI